VDGVCRGTSRLAVFIDRSKIWLCLPITQIFNRFSRNVRKRKFRGAESSSPISTPSAAATVVVHESYGIGRFVACACLNAGGNVVIAFCCVHGTDKLTLPVSDLAS